MKKKYYDAYTITILRYNNAIKHRIKFKETFAQKIAQQQDPFIHMNFYQVLIIKKRKNAKKKRKIFERNPDTGYKMDIQMNRQVSSTCENIKDEKNARKDNTSLKTKKREKHK